MVEEEAEEAQDEVLVTLEQRETQRTRLSWAVGSTNDACDVPTAAHPQQLRSQTQSRQLAQRFSASDHEVSAIGRNGQRRKREENRRTRTTTRLSELVDAQFLPLNPALQSHVPVVLLQVPLPEHVTLAKQYVLQEDVK